MARRRFQSIEVILVAVVTFAVFFHQESLSPMGRALFNLRYGAIPVDMWDAWHQIQENGLTREAAVALLPLLTANYLHADITHIGMNMLFFWIFANVVSQAAGRALFLVIYLFAGAVAVLVHVHANPDSGVPMIGASGAIAGLEGAYFTFVFLWDVADVKVWPIERPVAPAGLAFIAIVNLVMDTGAFVGHSHDNIAYGAHVGGFLGGAFVAMVTATVWKPRRTGKREGGRGMGAGN